MAQGNPGAIRAQTAGLGLGVGLGVGDGELRRVAADCAVAVP